MTTADTFRPTWKGASNIPDKIPADCFAVTTYRVEQRYGGPEEDGWWYNWWTPVIMVLCPTEADAAAMMERQRADDAVATMLAKEDGAAYNDACLRQAELTGEDPDSIGSLDGDDRFVTVVETPDDYLGRVQYDRPHYE